MRDLLLGKASLITGAGGDIGRATCLYFARQGAAVTAADQDESRGTETIRQVEAQGGRGHFVRADITVEADVEAAVASAVRAYGKLDSAFNNAGIIGPFCPVADLPTADWEKVLRIDLLGTFLCLKHEVRAMLKTGGGAIVNNSSGTALVGSPGMSAYSSAKSGMLGLTRTAAAENAGRGVRVNAILPGAVRAGMSVHAPDDFVRRIAEANPMGRLAEPDEIAAAAAWLCSPATAYITGQSISVDGGSSISN